MLNSANNNNDLSEVVAKSSQVDIERNSTEPHQHHPLGLLARASTKLAPIKWSNVLLLSLLHFLTLLGILLYCFTPATIHIRTVAFTYLIGALSGLGMTVGGHRLWAHRSFKARLPLKIFLVLAQTMTMNGSALSYARDHRTHHKNTDTEADPKNPSRGLFYSHIGWWMLRKSEKVKAAGRKLDFTDLSDDWAVRLQHRFYVPLFVLLGVALPIAIPYFLWNESLTSAFFVAVIFRLTLVLHYLFTVNSIAHYFGHRPFDYRIRPTENRLIVWLSFGEGNHNFHHTFPYDYTSSGNALYEHFNPSTLFINLCRRCGLAYDCKRASAAVIEGTIKRKGVPAYFDPPRGLCFRVTNGVFDWIIGTVLELWPVAVGVAYELVTGKTIFVKG